MAQPAATKQSKEKKLVFEKVKFDPLSNPGVFGIGIGIDNNTMSPTNIDSGWESDEKKDKSSTTNKSKLKSKSKKETDDNEDENDNDETEEYNYDAIEANIERAKKKKKVDFRAEMTSDSQDIDDLLLFQSKEKNEKEKIAQIDEELLNVGDDDLLNVEKEKKGKSLEQLLSETDDMFKEVQDKQGDISNDLNMDVNVDDDFNFDQYINQQTTDND
mmetsp:Transcript_27767/g.24570  ORF Transcript_27767/g.24570 Transcript_27767/m.24570 type:complete len:216 (+) Transcript_27767:20-667(+)|eukprot:CAMPEP_0201588104 /NCGR_PEP_ID=MMETSP0190_2-20130828/151484_1 /ASSEMBLY_ACC=CAM_ASM_000263 /TAXON_ID=37353 /ORGANISM="Rosalina sp." /LENGTH=215 /DNA_ID=CAMNT_0048039607 /DNA_START=19 /DNA_END=666 /DNA_ORIENTATION=+